MAVLPLPRRPVRALSRLVRRPAPPLLSDFPPSPEAALPLPLPLRGGDMDPLDDYASDFTSAEDTCSSSGYSSCEEEEEGEEGEEEEGEEGGVEAQGAKAGDVSHGRDLPDGALPLSLSPGDHGGPLKLTREATPVPVGLACPAGDCAVPGPGVRRSKGGERYLGSWQLLYIGADAAACTLSAARAGLGPPATPQGGSLAVPGLGPVGSAPRGGNPTPSSSASSSGGAPSRRVDSLCVTGVGLGRAGLAKERTLARYTACLRSMRFLVGVFRRRRAELAIRRACRPMVSAARQCLLLGQ